MFTAVIIGPRHVFVDYEPDEPLNGFYTKQSAAAFAQGLLTKDEAMSAQWLPAGREPTPKATWRR